MKLSCPGRLFFSPFALLPSMFFAHFLRFCYNNHSFTLLDIVRHLPFLGEVVLWAAKETTALKCCYFC